MQPKCVQIAEQHNTLDLPASESDTTDSLSSKVVSGRALVSLTSVRVSLLTKMISPFHLFADVPTWVKLFDGLSKVPQ